MTDLDHVLETIDAALADHATGPDAMRWAPDVDPPEQSSTGWVDPELWVRAQMPAHEIRGVSSDFTIYDEVHRFVWHSARVLDHDGPRVRIWFDDSDFMAAMSDLAWRTLRLDPERRAEEERAQHAQAAQRLRQDVVCAYGPGSSIAPPSETPASPCGYGDAWAALRAGIMEV